MTVHTLLNLLRNNDLKSIGELTGIYLRRFAGRTYYRPDIYYGKIDTGAVLEFKLSECPTVSIVIPVHNEWDYTYSCLYSVLANTDGISCELIVADDASSDETKYAPAHVKGIKVVRNENRLGFIKNCNNAAKAATGSYLLFLNNDTNVQKNWLSSLVGLMESDPKIGVVGSKLVYPDGKLQDAGGIIWKDASCWSYGRWDDPEKAKYGCIREVDYLSGASLLIRSGLWKMIGGFDERYSPAYYEDADLALEARNRGYRVVYQPESIVVHFEGVSCGRDESRGVKSYQPVNRKKFFEKWKNVLEREYSEPGKIQLRPQKMDNKY